MFWVYNLLITLLSPIWVPVMLVRSRRRKEPVDWAERTGDSKVPTRLDGKRVWVHAVSVGEVVASLPVLRALREELPDFEIVLSVTTSSGHGTARTQAAGLYDHLIYFPIDIVRFQVAAMSRVRPAVVAVMETELWMNFLWSAKQFGARTMLINGRISDRSAGRMRYVRWLYQAMLRFLDVALMQTERDAERIRSIGAKQVEVLGNAKFDQALEAVASTVNWREELGLNPDLPVIVIGSTRGEEEEHYVLDAIAQIGFDRVQVIHAPRHMERVPALEAQIKQRTGAVALRSRGESGPYLLLDTYGELASVYGVADVVVIGGGFANLGGQNLLQALAHGKHVICGPHMQNFSAVVLEAKSWEAVTQVSGEDLARAIQEQLARSDAERADASARIRASMQTHQGAAKRYAAAIAEAARIQSAVLAKHNEKRIQSGR